jgi:hypothetical protein
MAWLDLIVRAFHEIAWPAAAAWIAWYFRDPIVAQLPRVTKVGPVALQPLASSQANATAPGKIPNEDTIRKIEAAVPTELLQEARITIEGLFPNSRDGDLLTLSSALLIGGVFERTYNFVFGSQIALLQQLNSIPQTVEQARAYYERAGSAFPEIYKNYTFEQWLNFLQSFLLTTKEGDRISITQRGRGFLRYIVENGYSIQKAG